MSRRAAFLVKQIGDGKALPVGRRGATICRKLDGSDRPAAPIDVAVARLISDTAGAEKY